jgi:peptidyl-dipeptidase A
LQQSLTNKLESIYAVAKVCTEQNTCLSLDPDLSSMLKTSRDYNQVLWAWKGWHDATGPKMRSIYTKIVEIQNRGAVFSGYKDLSERWIEDYEDENFEKKMDNLFAQIKPFYEELHAYTRRKLNQIYGKNYPANHDPKLIPAHLLGNMWAQTWDNIYDILVPFPEATQPNLTKILHEKEYDAVKIFRESERFFTSIGLYEMTPTFWKESMITKPKNREVQCHASATDFYNQFDYRIKMCTSVNEEDFYVVHHEMGHIEYFMAYSKQPAVFRTGANSAFHEGKLKQKFLLSLLC